MTWRVRGGSRGWALALKTDSASWDRGHRSPLEWAESQFWTGSQKVQDKRQNNRTDKKHYHFLETHIVPSPVLTTVYICDLT